MDPSQGGLNPGGEVPIPLSISGMLNPGYHTEAIYAHTVEGDEPLTITVRSLCQPPLWELDERAYQYSMSVDAQVSLKDAIAILH